MSGLMTLAKLTCGKQWMTNCFAMSQDGLKMGKSLGNVLDPVALVAAYGADAVRFFFLKEVDFGQVSKLRSLTASPSS